MKAHGVYGNGVTAPVILKLRIRWTEVSFMPQLM